MQTRPLEELYKHVTTNCHTKYSIDCNISLKTSHNAFWDAFMAGVCFNEFKKRINVMNYINCVALFKNNIFALKTDIFKSEKMLSPSLYVFEPNEKDESKLEE